MFDDRGGMLAGGRGGGIAGLDLVEDINVFAEYEVPPAAFEVL